LSGVSDPKKKIASLRVSTISPVIASCRYPLVLRGPTTSRDVRGGAFPLVQITPVRPGVGKCTGGEAQSTPSLHCWFVCCNQLNSRFLPDLRPGLQSCNTTNLTALNDERLLLDFGVLGGVTLSEDFFHPAPRTGGVNNFFSGDVILRDTSKLRFVKKQTQWSALYQAGSQIIARFR